MATVFLVSFLGACISAIVGTFWYGPFTPMGRWHMSYLGFDKLTMSEKAKLIASAKPRMWKTYTGQMILSFLTSFFIAFVTSETVNNGGPASASYFYVAFIWLAFTVPMVGQNLLWGNCERRLAWKRFFSDSVSNLLSFLLIASVATLFF